MESNRSRRNDHATVVSNPDQKLRDGRSIAATTSAAIFIGNLPFAPQLLEAVLENVATSVPSAGVEDTFDGPALRPLSEERSGSSILPTYSASSARLENTLHEQIVSIPAPVEPSLIRLLRDAGRDTESSLNTKVTSMIRTVVRRAMH